MKSGALGPSPSYRRLARLYLNGYIPGLQTGPGVVRFLVDHLKFPVASPALLGQLSKRHIAQVQACIQQHDIPIVVCTYAPWAIKNLPQWP